MSDDSLGAPASPSGSTGSAPSPSVSALRAPILGAEAEAELEAFERWAQADGYDMTPASPPSTPAESFAYVAVATHSAWLGWEGRAELARMAP